MNILSGDLYYLNYFIRFLMVKLKSKVVNTMEIINFGSGVICNEL